MITTMLTLPYEIARLPLVVAERALAAGLADTSAPRVLLGRTMGSVDRVAGALLSDPALVRRGADRIDRVEKLVTAARLEREAAARREQARETRAAGGRQASQQRDAADNRAETALETADQVEESRKREAAATAGRAAAAKKAAATRRAEARKASVESSKDRVVSVAEAKKRSAERTAEDELDQVRQTERDATAARADAERLSDLTEARNAERKKS